MQLDEKPTHYEVLSLTPDASASQVREAYLRIKSTYAKDNLALYTLIDPAEREEMIRQVEEAYAVLSDLEKRKAYDACHGLIGGRIEEPFPRSEPRPGTPRIVSIDRVPPMAQHSSDDLLVPPSTDFTTEAQKVPSSSISASSLPPPPPPPTLNPHALPALPEVKAESQAEEIHWTGSTLKRVRESRGLSIEELSHTTKISKAYLFAIEEENYVKLPAAVFVRGFVNQVARALRLPTEDVVNAYMARFLQARPEPGKK